MHYWLIQGFFFQEKVSLGIAHASEQKGGARAVIRTNPMYYMWSGVIYTDEDGNLTGEVLDYFGESELTDVVISKKRISFQKRYKARTDTIDYGFGPKDGTWIGKYSGKATGEGVANCILTEVTDAFVQIK